ncbi:MAG: PDZ domain-containing protein [Myxococcota bacterium]
MVSTESRLSYRVRVLPAQHELDVEMTLTGVPGASDVKLAVPTWVPGAYGFMKYGRAIFDLRARDSSSGAALPVTREGWSGWRVKTPGTALTVQYRVSCYDPAWSELVGIVDSDQAILLGTNYLAPEGYRGPCSVSYALPEGWKVHHSSGAEGGSSGSWSYPSYRVLLDTPVVLGNFERFERNVGGTTFHMVFMDRALGFEREAHGLMDAVANVAKACHGIFGSFPFKDYTFIMSFSPLARWGLEHVSATMIAFGDDGLIDKDARARAVRLAAHELFHAWNVCTLRPAALANPALDLLGGSFTESLWVAEGFTRYYEYLLSVRAGALPAEDFLSNLVNFHRQLTAQPAYTRTSAVDSSLATFLNHNRYPGSVNNSVDYYDLGMLIAFDMDIILRTQKSPSSLDAEFAAFYAQYAKAEGGYTHAQFKEFFTRRCPALSEVFERAVESAGGLRLEESFQKLGYRVEKQELPYLGIVLEQNERPVIANVLHDSPAGASGLASQDELLKLNGFPYSTRALRWCIANEKVLHLEVRRGHRHLSFEVKPGTRWHVGKLTWAGTEAQAALLREWFKLPGYVPTSGKEVALSAYDNFHGIQTVL